MTPLEKVSAEWLEHPFTEVLRRHLRAQQQSALRALIAEARKSSDPMVTKRCAEYEQLGSFLGQLGKERDDGRPDGND